MASFGAATFLERSANAWKFPTHATTREAERRWFPGGESWTIHDAGGRKEPLVLAIRCTTAELASLRSAAGQSRTLSYSAGSVTAYLFAVRSIEEYLAEGVYSAELEFWVS